MDRIDEILYLYEDDRVEMADGGQLVKPNIDGSRPGYAGVTKIVSQVEGNPGVFIAESGTGKKFYLSKMTSLNREAGPSLKKRFPLTKEGKSQAIKAIAKHKKDYPEISIRPLYKGQKVIQKRKDGVLTYARKNQPTKTYDPKKYGSEAKAFKAAQKDVAAAQVAKKTAAIKNIDVKKIKQMRSKGMSVTSIAEELEVQPRTISDRLIKAGESTKNLNIRVIPKEIQKDLIAKYPQIKNWNFEKHALGFPYSENKQLYSRVQDFLSDPKPYEIAGDFSKAEGWMAQQMNRSYKLGNKNYKPIKAMVNNKNKIVGFIDNTEFGGGGKYIVNEKFIKGKNADGIVMSLHPDYADTAKFVDISKKAKLPVEGTLKNLLKNEGIDTTRISLSDLFKYMKGEVGIEGTKNALERHHISGVKSRATGNYQLLDRDLNALGKYITQEIETGDLSRVGELKKRGARVEVGGKMYGSGPKTPEGQFKKFETSLEKFYKSPESREVLEKLKKIKTNVSQLKGAQLGTFCKAMSKAGFATGGNVTASCLKAIDDNPARAISAAAKISKPTGTLKNVVSLSKTLAKGTGYALLGELAIAAPIALYQYGKGESAKRMIGDATYGLAGQNIDDEKREFMGEEGFKAHKLVDDLGQLDNLTTEFQDSETIMIPEDEELTIQQMNKKEKDIAEGLQSYENEDGSFNRDKFNRDFDTGTAGLKNIEDVKGFRRDVRRDEDYDVFEDEVMAAGGGLITLKPRRPNALPPESGPNSQGLENLKYYVTNT